ncbi:DUF6932 family protein [Cypionkella psychrotolerans]|uniref:DUF6932 family protein n=1 Tax=Cypionkella psychrotolerans TaxID=1678131 RepID=UPI0006B49A25|nr:hypothetical protein [Cypionkella psychrotolerans]
MAIPEFAPHGALPPYVDGNPTSRRARSPYSASIFEVVERFCTSPHRAKLLTGLNEYRKHLHQGGFISGTQWVDGSFVKNVELTLKRDPKDIDIITLFNRPIKYQVQPTKWDSDYETHLHGAYFHTKRMKPIYLCDTYGIDLDVGQMSLIRDTTYWMGLFTDIRGSFNKKGIVEIPLASDPMEFSAVAQAIGGKYNV